MAEGLTEVQKKEVVSFKKLIERFVAYLEHLQSIKDKEKDKEFKEPSKKERATTWTDIQEKLSKSNKKEHKGKTVYPLGGKGHAGAPIQKVLFGVDIYEVGRICFSAESQYDKGYVTKANLLHWYYSDINIYANWNDKQNEITSLTVALSTTSGTEEAKEWLKSQNKSFDEKGINYTLKDLELFDGKEPNKKVQDMYSKYTSWFENHKPYIKSQQLNGATNLLKANKNLILTGAPGTGKTFMAKNIAAKLIFGDTNLHDYAEYDNWKDGKEAFENQVKFVQFHPSYDYTDFVEGLRPYDKDSNGTPGFRRQDGVFKKFCKEALKSWDEEYNKASGEGDEKRNNALKSESLKKYIFIIDEINRGELNKILGELFFSIDPGYRGEKGKTNTQYQNLVDYERNEKGELLDKDGNVVNDYTQAQTDAFKPGFFIPENVYIIGTMNDIDRSVDAMDFAIRRRFAWKEVLAKDTIIMLDNLTSKLRKNEQKYDIIEHMNRLNDAIEKIFDSTSYQIGASYFLKIKEYLNAQNEVNNESFNKLWDYHLYGVLQEYVRGRNDAKELLKQLKNAYDGKNGTNDEEETLEE